MAPKSATKGQRTGQSVVLSHGRSLGADARDSQKLYLGWHGCRVTAHDRGSHGLFAQISDDNNMDQYAGDLAELIAPRVMHDVILVGDFTGAGEVAPTIGRYRTAHLAKAVPLGLVA